MTMLRTVLDFFADLLSRAYLLSNRGRQGTRCMNILRNYSLLGKVTRLEHAAYQLWFL